MIFKWYSNYQTVGDIQPRRNKSDRQRVVWWKLLQSFKVRTNTHIWFIWQNTYLLAWRQCILVVLCFILKSVSFFLSINSIGVRERVDTWPLHFCLGTVFLWWKLQLFAWKKKWKFVVTLYHLSVFLNNKLKWTFARD